MLSVVPPSIFNKYQASVIQNSAERMCYFILRRCHPELPANGNTKMHASKAKGYFLQWKTTIQVCTMVKKLLPGNTETRSVQAE